VGSLESHSVAKERKQEARSAARDTRSLDLCAIGLGQGGGNLAAEWGRRGHRVLLINTARSDMRALSRHESLAVSAEQSLYIGQEGVEGAGRDPDYGASCVAAKAEEIREAVAHQLAGADAILLCAGLGGGTGSAVYELVKVLEPLEIPVVTVTTLPSEAESGIAKVNAVKSTSQLINAPLNGRVFIDNERLVEAFPDLDIVTYYPQVNARVLAPLDEVNRLNRRDDLWSIRSFDGEDLRKVLLSGGLLGTHVEALGEDIDADKLVAAVGRCIDGGAHLAPGLTIADVAYCAVVVVGPEEVLRGVSFKVFDDAIGIVKEASGGGAVYEGIYVADDDKPPRVYVISASFHMPDRIGALLKRASSEGRVLADKVHEDIPELEISPLEGLELFRAPGRKKKPDRPKAPPPRPLGAQLEVDLPAIGEDKPGADPTFIIPRPVSTEGGEAEASSEVGDVVPRVGSGVWDEAAAREAARQDPTRAVSRVRKRNKAERKEITRNVILSGEGMVVFDDGPAGGGSEPPKKGVDFEKETSVYDVPDSLREESGAVYAAAAAEFEELEETAFDSIEDLPGYDDEATVRRPDQDRPASTTMKKDPPKKPVSKPVPRIATDRAHPLPEDADVDYDLDEASNVYDMTAVSDLEDSDSAEDELTLGSLAERYPVIDEGDEDKTTTDARPEWAASYADDSALVSAIESATEVQRVFEDLLERFRQAGDRRARHRVARRLIDDSQAKDVEVRALAVWAMVKLEDRGFRRALEESARDENPEIAKLAIGGLERLGTTRPKR
jgi:cell division GTPase FtsZ